MRAFRNKSSSRSAPSCSYCRQSDHRIADCPHAERDWASLKQGTIPLSSATPVSWYKLPKYWSEWYGRAETAVAKIEAAKARANKKRTASTTPRTCGFCGGTGHTRRTCGHMSSFITKCKTANANWKRAAYDKLVTEMGIYVGSAIKVKERGWNASKQSAVALITSVNYDELNVTTGFRADYHNGDYVQPIKIQAIVNGETVRIIISDNSVVSSRAIGWGCWHYGGKMTSNATPLDPEWATTDLGEWDWLAKKRTQQRLDNMGLLSHINTWAITAQ
jgi:hypothetical protein